MVSSHNMVTTTVWGFINSRIIAVAIGVSMQLHAYNHLLSRCSRENSGIRYHQPIKSKGGVLLVKSRFRTLRGDRVRSHFPLEEIFQNAQLNSCTRELTGKICRREFAGLRLSIFASQVVQGRTQISQYSPIHPIH